MNNKEVSEQILQAAQLLQSAAKKLQAEETENTQAEQQETEPDIQRVPYGNFYQRITFNAKGKAVKFWESETQSNVDKFRFMNNNYFTDKTIAQSLADKINFLMELQRYHDIYCPDYKPDWNNTKEKKYCVYFDAMLNKYYFDYYCDYKLEGQIYFPTAEIAQKVCDKLNAELRKEV